MDIEYIYKVCLSTIIYFEVNRKYIQSQTFEKYHSTTIVKLLFTFFELGDEVLAETDRVRICFKALY